MFDIPAAPTAPPAPAAPAFVPVGPGGPIAPADEPVEQHREQVTSSSFL